MPCDCVIARPAPWSSPRPLTFASLVHVGLQGRKCCKGRIRIGARAFRRRRRDGLGLAANILAPGTVTTISASAIARTIATRHSLALALALARALTRALALALAAGLTLILAAATPRIMLSVAAFLRTVITCVGAILVVILSRAAIGPRAHVDGSGGRLICTCLCYRRDRHSISLRAAISATVTSALFGALRSLALGTLSVALRSLVTAWAPDVFKDCLDGRGSRCRSIRN